MEQKEYDVVKVTLSGDSCKEDVDIQAIVVEKVCSNLRGQSRKINVEMYPHLRGLFFAKTDANESQEVGILIGLDHYWDIVRGDTIKGEFGPVATATKFGYILSGVNENYSNEVQQTLSPTVLRIEGHTKNDDVQLRNFWDLETLGIVDENEDGKLDLKINKEQGKYHVNLPWKVDHDVLCDNYDIAEKRLMFALKRL